MKWTQGLGIGVLAVFAMAAGAFVATGGNFSSASDSVPMPNQQEPVKKTDDGELQPSESGTLSVAAYDEAADSTTQVASELYVWNTEFDTMYQKTGSASSWTDFSNFNGQDGYKAVSFDSTYPYGKVAEGKVTRKTTPQKLSVYEGVSSSNLDQRVYYDGDSVSSISLGADEQKTLDSIYAKVNTNDKTFNPRLVVVDYSDSSNVSDVRMPSAESVKVPENLKDSGYDDAFRVKWDVAGEKVQAGQGAPIMMGYDSGRTVSGMTIQADADGTSGETITIGLVDYAPFINQNDDLAYGVTDDSSTPSDVGLSLMTQTLTLN